MDALLTWVLNMCGTPHSAVRKPLVLPKPLRGKAKAFISFHERISSAALVEMVGNDAIGTITARVVNTRLTVFAFIFCFGFSVSLIIENCN